MGKGKTFYSYSSFMKHIYTIGIKRMVTVAPSTTSVATIFIKFDEIIGIAIDLEELIPVKEIRALYASYRGTNVPPETGQPRRSICHVPEPDIISMFISPALNPRQSISALVAVAVMALCATVMPPLLILLTLIVSNSDEMEVTRVVGTGVVSGKSVSPRTILSFKIFLSSDLE